MSVYKEGYLILKNIEQQSRQVWSDACDFGALVKKDDSLFRDLKQLIEWYGVSGTRSRIDYSSGCTVTQTVELMDEWAVSDERKTVEEATEFYKVSFISIPKRHSQLRDYLGYITVEKLETSQCNHNGTMKLVHSGGDAENGPETTSQCTKCGFIETTFGM